MQVTHAGSRSARIREQLDHPVIDGDGHVIELAAVFADYVRDHGRGDLVEKVPELRMGLKGSSDDIRKGQMSMKERREAWLLPISYHHPAGNTEYLATVTTPSRYYERLGEAGVDFAVLYPTSGLSLQLILDDDARVTLCRLYNEWMAEQYRPYRDKFTMAALIPMTTPDEAIAAMVRAKELGAKVGLIASFARRPLPGQSWPPSDPGAGLRVGAWEVHGWIDTFGIDSVYDYDPVWAKAIELGLPLAAHSSGMGFSDRASISNFMFNQIGHFAASGAALAKSLFLGGVTRRFPQLRIAMLEGGVAPGVQIYITLVANWLKRNPEAMGRLDPSNADETEFAKLVASDPELARYSADDLLAAGRTRTVNDDFAAAGITSVEDIRDRFCNNFCWGCEADDPLVGLAFDRRILPLEAKVPAIFSSDLGHWDVPDFDTPLAEAHELVEHGILDEEEFRDFVWANPAKFYQSLNPDFFAGTSVEAHVEH